jgi:hypothetical protein
MAQHDYIIANQSGAAFRADLNGALAAGVTQNSGATEPAVTYAYMPWADITSGIFKIRNAGNNGWISLFQLDGSASFVPPSAGLITNAGISGSAAIALSKLATGALPTAITVASANIDSAGIADTKLATITTAGKVSNSATTATATNTANAIVTRDASGNFSAGTITAAVTGTASGNSRLVRTTAVVTTSGTSVDFTGIPSWVKRITVAINGVSTNGTSPVQIQLGDSGGIETSGYFGGLATITGTNTSAFAAFSSGFAPLGATTGATRAGILSIVNIASDTWVASGTFDDSATAAGLTQGAKLLSATLDRIRLTTVNGTDTFDAGSVNIIYEG